MANGLTLTGFVDYIKENNEIDIEPIVLKLGTLDAGAGLQSGIRSSAKLTAVGTSEAMIQAGSYITSEAAGEMALSQVEIAVVQRHIKENYDPQVLIAKITQLAMQAGSTIDDLPAYIKNALITAKNASVAKKNEQSLWLGDTTLTGSAASVRHLEDFDGFIKLAQESDNTVKTAAESVAMTAANAIAQVELQTSLLPGDLILENTTLFMSPSEFQIARAAYMNLYKNTQVFGDNVGGMQTTYQIPGTNITLQAMTGLATSKERILCMPEDLIVGVDLQGEEENAEMRLLENRSIEYFAVYKLGCQIGRGDYIVVTAPAV